MRSRWRSKRTCEERRPDSVGSLSGHNRSFEVGLELSTKSVCRRTSTPRTRSRWLITDVQPECTRLNNFMSDTGYVVEASALEVIVKAPLVGLQNVLVAMGFEHRNDESGTYCINVRDDGEKAALFDRLRRQDFCFAAGPGWSPAEVFERFRDEGLLDGAYRRIAWRSPGSPLVEER